MTSVEKVKLLCKERKIPISRLEKDLGYANGYIGQLRKGTFPSDRLVDIANYLGVPLSHFTSEAKGVVIPVLGDVAAGIPMDAVENIVDYEEIDAALAASGELFGLRIKGSSMEPRILEGDVVIVRKQEDVQTGDVAVVLVNGNTATVKRIKKETGGIWLLPNNPAYDAQYYSLAEILVKPVTIVGKVVELRGKV